MSGPMYLAIRRLFLIANERRDKFEQLVDSATRRGRPHTAVRYAAEANYYRQLSDRLQDAANVAAVGIHP